MVVNIALWVVQILVGLAFVAAGSMKASQPKEKLATNMAWVEDFGGSQVRLIGALEVLGGLGLILPAATGILPWLTPVAAIGLALTMLGAAVTHLRRGERSVIGVNVVLLALTVFVAVGRIALAPL